VTSNGLSINAAKLIQTLWLGLKMDSCEADIINHVILERHVKSAVVRGPKGVVSIHFLSIKRDSRTSGINYVG
jgi:hypothetical protein